MARSRSLRPRKPGALSPHRHQQPHAPHLPHLQQQVEALFRSLGRAEPGLLEAALEGRSAKRSLEKALAEPTLQLIAQAYAVCLEAHEAFKRASPAQRGHLRGFSLQLLALAAEQALALDRAHTEYERRKQEQEESAARLKEMFARDLRLAAQARLVLHEVSGGDPAHEKELSVVDPPETVQELAQTLRRLAQLGGGLLRSSLTSVRGRARLYGLDENFLNGLVIAATELVGLEERAGDQSALTTRRNQIDRAQAAAYVLMRQIGEAFEVAAGVDPQIAPLASAQPRVEPTALRAAKKAAKTPVTVVDATRPAPSPQPATAKVIGPAPALRVIDPAELGSTKKLPS